MEGGKEGDAGLRISRNGALQKVPENLVFNFVKFSSHCTRSFAHNQNSPRGYSMQNLVPNTPCKQLLLCNFCSNTSAS